MTTAKERLALLLPTWTALLSQWAMDGEIAAAAQQALQLTESCPGLDNIQRQWAEGDTSGLPAIELLDAEGITGAAGAYSASTRTIYLNTSWIENRSSTEITKVIGWTTFLMIAIPLETRASYLQDYYSTKISVNKN